MIKGIEVGMVSGTCFHGKCVFLRVEHKIARAHVRMDDLARFDTFLAPAVDTLLRSRFDTPA